MAAVDFDDKLFTLNNKEFINKKFLINLHFLSLGTFSLK